MSIPHKADTFFYNATVKPPSAILKSFTCHFTMTQEKLDTNLVTVQGNMLNVYTLEQHTIDMKINSQFNDKIVECIPVPVPARPNRSARKREIESALQPQPDLLFVLTASFNCALVYFDRQAH